MQEERPRQEGQEVMSGNAPTETKKLTEKQRIFVDEYLVDLNATQAAIRAGYSENTATEIGYENLSKPHIAEKIQEAFNKRAERTEIDADYVLTGLKEIAERCMTREPVYEYDEDGKKVESGEWTFQHAGANKALELLGKNLKLFTDKVETTGTFSVTIPGKDVGTL